jgi:hypothetical protein
MLLLIFFPIRIAFRSKSYNPMTFDISATSYGDKINSLDLTYWQMKTADHNQ